MAPVPQDLTGTPTCIPPPLDSPATMTTSPVPNVR